MHDSYKKKALSRLHKLRGQIDGVINMIEKGKHQMDIVTQILALQGAVKSVSTLLIESHISAVTTETIDDRNRRKRDKLVKELVKACEMSQR